MPHNIPTDISRAQVVLNQDSIAVGGTVQSLDFTSQDKDYPVPQINLGWVSIDASYNWAKDAKSPLSVKASFLAELRPSKNAIHKQPATLVGAMVYDGGKWTLSADLEGLYLSSLYNFFSQKPSDAPDETGEADHVLPLIEAVEIASMKLTYVYDKTPTTGDEVVGSSFTFDGLLKVSDLQLKLDFSYEKKKFKFRALLHAGSTTTIGKVIEDLVGDAIDVPGFLYDANLDPKKDSIEIDVIKGSSAKKGTPEPFHFVAKLTVNFPEDVQISLTFAQWHGSNWSASEPSKKLIKVALTGIPHVTIPLVGDVTQPFDEMYFMYVIDATKNKSPKQSLPGITRKEKDDLNLDEAFKDHPIVVKDKAKDSTSDDVMIISAGAHFTIVIKDERGQRVCILDYNFKKQRIAADEKPGNEKPTIPAEETKEPAEKDSDGSAASAPLKKKMGGLSISDIGLKYEKKILSISFTATMELGPMGFSLIGFALNMELTSLNLKDIKMLPPSLEGFSVAFERKPLTIAGIIRHGKTPELEYYAGGLIVGWTPYQLEAAGFYGKAKPVGRDPFVSVFVFAKLAGPLVSLEFAEISGVTGGFGYNSSVRVPTADQITSFPFIDQHSTDGAADALQALQKLTSTGQDAWFQPLPDTYWAAAGMKIDAFQMIALDAVVVVQFGASIKLGIFGVALADIPSSVSDFKFAHVELGIAVVVDFDIGVMKVEAQLSPKSFILHPSCKLTGGFALWYWFDAPHADQVNVGNFVFSLGGYHQAFKVPVGWPVPERLKISWGLGNDLSISGEAFFAITPKVCMGGGRLRASYSAGPIAAWFDAFANFLIQYQPFHFTAEAGVCIGASFNLDVWFIHIHISVEVSADLYLWGPPLAGIVSVNIKVAKFNIHFGDDNKGPSALHLDEFFNLVLQASSKQKAAAVTTMAVTTPIKPIMEPEEAAKYKRMSDNGGHNFLAQFGLLNDSSDPKREQNAEWVVRSGTFSFSIGCKMMVDDVKLVGNEKEDINSKASGAGSIYAKPMKTDSILDSHMTVQITQPQQKQVWGMSQEYKSVPTGLWQKCKRSSI